MKKKSIYHNMLCYVGYGVPNISDRLAPQNYSKVVWMQYKVKSPVE